MGDISTFRLGNYAQFDGELQRIKTQIGLDNAAFLDPLPITVETFVQIGYEPWKETAEYSVYLFKTGQSKAITVTFNAKKEFLVMEQGLGIEYPFIKFVHELQNLIENKGQNLSKEPGTKKSILIR